MKCGLIGLPNVGKSSIFNSLSSVKAKSSNYPFCTIEPNISMVEVPDNRLFELQNLIESNKIIPSICKILDIAGLVKDAHKGKGLGNKFLSNIRETSLIIHVLRFFDNKNICHVENNINPIRDKEIVDTELQIKDLEYLEKYLNTYKKYTDNKENIKLINKIINFLIKGKNIRSIKLDDNENFFLEKLQLFTNKPVIYICNVNNINKEDKNIDIIKKIAFNENAEVIILSAKNESEIASLSNKNDKKKILKKFNIQEPIIYHLIRTVYKKLNLQNFFTIGKKEIKSWTIKKGTTALEASGYIHNDIKKGFIRAEIIHYNDYIKYKSEKNVKNFGKMFLEGKKYIIKDGDIIHFRFNL